MSDLDALRARSIPFLGLVDASGVAIDGTSTLADLRAKQIPFVCQVNASGIEPDTSATLNTLRARQIPFFCEVDETGVDPVDGATLAELRARQIPAACLVDSSGIAQGGTATLNILRARGIEFFCPVDENGDETSLGARLSFTGTVAEGADEDTVVGTVTLVDPQSIYAPGGTWSITAQEHANWFKIDSATGEVSAGSSATDFETDAGPTITVEYDDGVLDPLSREFTVTVTDVDEGGGSAPSMQFNAAANSQYLALLADF